MKIDSSPRFVFLGVALVTAFTTARADNKVAHVEMWRFDDKPITAASPGKGQDVLKITGHIYARVFFDRSIQDVFGLTPERGTLRVYELLTDDKTGHVYDTVELTVSKRDLANKWIDLDIIPDPTQMHDLFATHSRHGFYGPWLGTEDRPFTVTGRHQVYFSLTGPNHLKDEDQRAALLTIDFTGIDVARLDADAKKVFAASRTAADKDTVNASKGTKLPAKGQLHTVALVTKTEKSIKLANKDLVAVKLIVTGDTWEVVRNRLSSVILRRIAGAAVVTKDKAGKCTLVTNGAVTQEYVGGKFIADGSWSDKGAHEDLIDCATGFR